MKWKIFYSDSAYTDADGHPEFAPSNDVQAIAVEDFTAGRRIERQSDFYIYVPNRGIWRGVDQFGLYDYLQRPGWRKVLFGRIMSDDQWRVVFKKACQDDYLPAKTNRLKTERTPD